MHCTLGQYTTFGRGNGDLTIGPMRGSGNCDCHVGGSHWKPGEEAGKGEEISSSSC